MNDDRDVEAMFSYALEKLGENPDREGLKETPGRWYRALKEMTVGYNMDPVALLKKSFASDNTNMVICNDIEFHSLCEHHVLPFIGKAHVAYIPNGRVVGISKLVRVVKAFALRLQIQEQLTEQIADALVRGIPCEDCMVVIEAQHLCMKVRGVRNPTSKMITSAIRGKFKESVVRQEFLTLIGRST